MTLCDGDGLITFNGPQCAVFRRMGGYRSTPSESFSTERSRSFSSGSQRNSDSFASDPRRKGTSGHDLYKRGEQALADNDLVLYDRLLQEMQKLYDDALSGSGDMYESHSSSNRSGGSGIMTRAESSASDMVSPMGVSNPSASIQNRSEEPGNTTSGLSLRSQSLIEESGRGAITSQSSTANHCTNPQDQEAGADAAVSAAVANARNTYNQEYNYSGSTENALLKVEEIIAGVDPALQQAVRDEIGDFVTWGENLRLQFGHPADATKSLALKTPEREMLLKRLANKLVQDQITLLGDKARYDDELILIVGGPGAGKTSTQNAFVETEGAIVLDPDVIKPLLPEYEALGPQFIHDESTHVPRLALVIAAEMDINTIVTGTGRDGTYLKEKIVAPFKERGYSVHGVLVEISPETAIGRVAQRVSEGGHGVHPVVIRDATLKAAETFGIMVNEGFYDEYIGLWNETPLGAPSDIRLLGPGVGERLRDRFERQSAAGSERDANSQPGSDRLEGGQSSGRVSRGAAGRGAQGDRREGSPGSGAVPSGNESEVSENAEVTTGADDLPAHVAGLLSPEQLAWVKRVRSENNARRGELNENRSKRIKDMRDKRRGAVDITLEDFEWVARNAIKSVLQGNETLNEAFGRLVFEERFRDDEIR